MHDHAFATGFPIVYGVDFSGARLAGRTTWLARLERVTNQGDTPPYRLTQLASLETLCGTAEREPVLQHLVRRIQGSDDALWALGFPFGLPVEVVDLLTRPDAPWPDQISFLRTWGEDAYGVGLECLRRAKESGHRGHIRRLTDIETKAPWDTYAYRIIYQTFYGMRDVLGPLRDAAERPAPAIVHETKAAYTTGTTDPAPAPDGDTAVLPFDYARLPGARRVVVEACPASTLKRLELPHQNYKQIESGELTRERKRTRRTILAGLAPHVSMGRVRRQLLLRDNGGDALDALLAAVGAALSWRETDHDQISAHPRYVREGRQYV